MRRNFLVNADAMRNEIGGLVRRSVDAQRRRGMKIDEAHATAGRRLGLTVRRVRAYLYGEVFKVPAHEAVGIVEGWRQSAEAQIAAMQAEIEAERHELERLKNQCDSMSALFSMLGGSEP